MCNKTAANNNSSNSSSETGLTGLDNNNGSTGPSSSEAAKGSSGAAHVAADTSTVAAGTGHAAVAGGGDQSSAQPPLSISCALTSATSGQAIISGTSRRSPPVVPSKKVTTTKKVTTKKVNGETDKIVLTDRKRRLIGDEFYKHQLDNSGTDDNEEVTIPTIVSEDHQIYTTTDTGNTAAGSLNYSSTSTPSPTPVVNAIPLVLSDEDLLKRFEADHESAGHDVATSEGGSVILYTAGDGTTASAAIDGSLSNKISLYGTASSEFSHTPSIAYMASILPQGVKNEPEDLTGARRDSSAHDAESGMHQVLLKAPHDKGPPVVVSTTDGHVVALSAADLNNATFTSVATSGADNSPYAQADFPQFDAGRPIVYPGEPYRTEADLYTTAAPADFATRAGGGSGEGQFVPYPYKGGGPAGGPAGGTPGAPHINSPDSGIGDPTLNAGQPESFDTYPHADILNDIGGRKPWHDYGRQNDEKIHIAKTFSQYGFKYTLEAPTSSSVRREDDRITYVNKGQFYCITLDYIMDPEGPPLKSNTVKSLIMLVFREGKTLEEEMKAWQFWHTRQHSVKQRILDADTKNSMGLLSNIEEVSHNALAVYWNPFEGPAKVNLAVQCLSTDFSTQKGVKGLPLHLQIDTYEDPRDSSGGPVYHRGYCQIKVFCDKGAERKARDEERRAAKRRLTTTGKRRLDEMYHTALERSEFYTMADLSKTPVLFTPTADPDKGAIDFGTELPSFYSSGSRGSPPEHNMLKLNGSTGSPSAPDPPLLPSNAVVLSNPTSLMSAGPLPEKRPKLYPPITERVMIYVRQETEDSYTALHLVPPTVPGLIRAIESKYKINAASIRYLFRKNKVGNVVKIDDDMVTFYCNEDIFLMQVVVTEGMGGDDNMVYDITLTEI